MRNNMAGASLVLVLFGSFQIVSGRSNGPYTLGFSVILIVIGMILGLIAPAIPNRPKPRRISPHVRIAIGFTILVVLMGFLGMVTILSRVECPPAVAEFRGSSPQQPIWLRALPPPPAVPTPLSPPATVPTSDGDFIIQSEPAVPAAKPEYTPPTNQPGEPTELVGGPEGWQFQVFDRDRRAAIGFRYSMGSWAGQPAVAEFTPLFDRNAPAGGASLVLARDEYVVGGLQVVAGDLVNAVRVVFVRQQTDGELDKSDSYVSDWIGNPGGKTPKQIGEGTSRVIGVCGRHGAVKNAVALILDNTPRADPLSQSSAARGEKYLTIKAVKSAPSRSDKPVYNPPPGQLGTPTELVGGPEGWEFQSLDNNRRPVVGFRFRMGSWAGQPAVAQFDPLYDRDHSAGRGSVVIGRDGYVVGGVQVVAADLVNAVRIIFVRQQADGSLHKSDFYLSDWIGEPGERTPTVLGDGKTPVIGVCGRNGAVKNALALILDLP